MQSVASIDRQGGYRSPSGDRSFYPTSIFKRAELANDEGAGRSPSPPTPPAAKAAASPPLLHRYRVGSLSAQPPRRTSTRSGSAPPTVADEPRTAPRVLTRSAQPPLQRRGNSPIAFKGVVDDDAKKAAVVRSPSPTIMPRSRSSQKGTQNAAPATAAPTAQQTSAEAATPGHHSASVTVSASRSGSDARHQPLPCQDTQCIHSRESIVEFIQMQRALRQCYAAMDRHDADLSDLGAALAQERTARQQAESRVVAEREALTQQCEAACTQLEAELEAHWQRQFDEAMGDRADTAALVSARDAEIERLHRLLSQQQDDSARAQAAQQEVIQNLQRTVREYDTEVVRLEDSVAEMTDRVSAATQARNRLSQRVCALEADAAASRAAMAAKEATSPSGGSRSPSFSSASGAGQSRDNGPATATTTPSRRFGRFRVLTPDASPQARHGESTPTPSVPPAYVLDGGQGRPPLLREASEDRAESGAPRTPPRHTVGTQCQEDQRRPGQEEEATKREDALRRAAKEADDRCKELLRALLDKEAQIAKMGAERTRFKRLYEQSQPPSK